MLASQTPLAPYIPGANGSGTALVASYKNGTDDAYNYTYDANGNITQIWRGSGDFDTASVKFSYVYDKANQLIRENLYYGSGNANNATYKYTYDSWGNIQTKKKYPYVTTSNISETLLIETITYGYTDTQWKDKLTSFNGQSITYDAMGNPTSYLGNTLSWVQGCQVQFYLNISSITFTASAHFGPALLLF